MYHPIDVHVGYRLKLRRTIMGLSQSALADPIGITFQQLQKYERGMNRMGASRLYAIAQILKTPVTYFFEGLEDGDPKPLDAVHVLSEQANLTTRETMEMARAYYGILDPAVRKKIFELIKILAL